MYGTISRVVANYHKWFDLVLRDKRSNFISSAAFMSLEDCFGHKS